MIEFQNVTFTYQSTERESGVYHLNMTIPDGQVSCFAGNLVVEKLRLPA